MSQEAFNATAPSGGRRVAVLLEYDGSRFAGSQMQSNAVTVQSVLEDAIARATEKRVRVAFAGRTDAGVHALGQVASFVTRTRLDDRTLRRALNAWLPQDVVAREVAGVEMDFDPRRDARKRCYRYLIENSDVRPALERARVWHVSSALDVAAMAAAARRVTGRHDFAAFASRLEGPKASTVRELFSFEVSKRNSRIWLDLAANAFLPHQVRRMTGALIEVGMGKLGVDHYAALLDGPPASAGPAAPAHGLYLMSVEYATPLFMTLDSGQGVC